MIIAEVLQSVDKVTTIIKRAGVSMSSDAFWGVLGTLLGTIIGYLLSEMHNHGRLHCFVKSWIAYFEIKDEGDRFIGCRKPNRPQYFNYCFTIEIYNSSRLPKVIRDGKIVFYKDEEPIAEFIPNDKKRETKYFHYSEYSELLAFCVPATDVITLDLLGNIFGDDTGFPFLEIADEVYFQYKNEKDKTERWKIADVKYDSYFYDDTEEQVDG